MDEKSGETKINLPKDFLLGAATSAHQVEGDNIHSDWWAAEQAGHLPKSGRSADHYNFFEEDLKIAREIGLNSFRISVEWARIEPKEGQWDSKQLEHYRKVLKTMRKLELKSVVTLHHYTLPEWLALKGGFETNYGVEAFGRFAWFIAKNLGNEIDFWCTVNEPEIYANLAFNFGKFPPFKRNFFLYLKVLENLILAHKKAFYAIKGLIPEAKISVAKNYTYHRPFGRANIFDRILTATSNRWGNHYFLDSIREQMDYVGLNYYIFELDKYKFPFGKKDMNFNFDPNHPPDPPGVRRSDMGWRIYPKGIYYSIKDLSARYKKPIYILENGIADAKDNFRKDFILNHLKYIAKAISEKADVRGYFYWSLIDNFEWAEGYGPKFGLIEVDFETMERKIRPSAKVFKLVSS